MSISDIFNAATTGITLQRLAIEVTGENIANVNTEGYSRQRVILETAQVREVANYSLGTGVKLGAIQRSYDDLLQKQIMDAGSTYNQNLAQQTALNQIEPLFNELTQDGLGKTIQDFFDSWHDLSLKPQGTAERQTVLARAQIMLDAFHQANASLENVKTNANSSLGAITADIAEKVKSIATLNDQIRLAELSSGASANELRDQRDLTIRQLSEKVGITYFEEQDGSLSVNLVNGQQLVNGSSYGTLYTYPNASGLNDIFITQMGNPPAAPDHNLDRNITRLVDGTVGSQGELGGTFLVRDGIVPDMQGKLDELAYKIASQVNEFHRSGWGLSTTSTNLDFFQVTPFNPATLNGDTTLNSNIIANIQTTGLRTGMSVSGAGIPANATITEILNPTSFKISAPATATGAASPLTIGGGYSKPTAIVMNITDPRDVAAGLATNPPFFGAGDATGDNRNALRIAQLMNSSSEFSVGNTTIAGYYSALVSQVGLETQSLTNVSTRGEAFLRQLKTLRDSGASVSLDEELTNMIKYQKAFEGSAKMITTATEMLDIVLNLVR
ncbi:flagellar hook-associated protein 1 [Geobacter sp. OR-1]|uniref:flagellar hook-associated protein FlgK n=1 Tax=Geobacter sp. OR-1 TaxID=1266765 RepID=UPI00054385FA|nr:flagellar hook-associated protein FlgK [Geobacter sp. OR-1]GAM09669.1 flagellar hook-associated protein 1 [Geobacter sp. OR-1]